MARLLSYLLLILLSGGVSAHAIGVSQSLEPAEIPFDGQALFKIEISWSGSQRDFFFPNPLRPTLERLRVGRFSSSVSSVGSGQDEITTKTYSYTLIPSLSGSGRVDEVAIDYISWPDSIPGQLLTEPMVVMIAAPVARPADDSMGLGLIFILAGLAILVIGIVLYFLLVVRRKAVPEKKLSPLEAFLETLEQARTEAGDDLKKFQGGLYANLIAYLAAQFDNIETTMNTDEIVSQFDQTKLTLDQRDHLAGWLKRAEKEKFSPVKPAPGDTMRLASEVRDYFEKNLS